jgi:hypothetical protein
MANSPIHERDLVDAAIAELRERFPSGWVIERSQRPVSGPPSATTQTLDGAIELQAPNGTYTTLAVEARRSFAPREVGQLLTGLGRSLRVLAGYVPLLVVSPWLSGRAQELLAAEGINYLDLTGNALLKLDNPVVFIHSAGAARNPEPPPRGPATIRGPKAARLVRLLADVRPPYGVGELASAAGLTAGYVSRLLDALDRDAVVERARRGAVTDVDVQALLRAWADDYDVLKTSNASPYLAPNGAADALGKLAAAGARTLVTGSFAAVRLAPVAAPAMLVAYSQDVPATAEALGLLPTDEAANVTLLRPFDEVVWARASVDGGIGYAAPSQVVVDCLTGNGRMPAEGEALLTWMIDHQEWRAPSLEALTPASSAQ